MKFLGETNLRSKHRDIIYIFECPICKIKVYKNMREGLNQKTCGNHVVKKNKIKEIRLYNIWRRMKQRCYDKNTRDYKWYGSKGIKLCEEWLNFYNFQEWSLNNKYKNNLTIDRIDNNKDYHPSNCHWITLSENVKKSINIKIHDLDKKEIKHLRNKNVPVKEIANKFGVCIGTIYKILKK